MLRKKFFAIVIFSMGIRMLLVSGCAYAKPKNLEDDLYHQIEIFSDAITAIQHDYVETVPSKDIIYGALKGMLSALDPYSQFMDPDTFKELQVETEGEFGGLGIEITIRDNLLTIITPLDGTPADKAGLQAQDRIVKIEDKITRDMPLTEAVKLLRGKPGTDVKLTIMRESEESFKEITVTRDIIEIKAVRKAELLKDNIGYIKLTDFSEKTKSDLDLALEKLAKNGMDSLIFDLRNNPGGLLISSVETVSEFLPTGKLIVYTKGREQNQNIEYRATGKTDFKNIPLIVMINGGSASASEIVAGAIQDHKRGIILGTKSFGKGSVQTVIPLRDGSALRLTTAKYYTPLGRTINEIGIIPDVSVKVELPREKKEAKKEKNIFDKMEKDTNNNKNNEGNKLPVGIETEGETTPDKKMEEKKEEKDEEEEFIRDDNQLRAAINLMNGIKIYNSLQKTN
ncbi:MAG: S41 family peptidase [Candidatus Omnitrophica bacterium]|nr:S41 family peptidase [Candidatus Omnitrophota bacterium]